MITIVCGPSFSGKTTFISQHGAGLMPWPDTPVVDVATVFARSGKAPFDDLVLHDNINRVTPSSLADRRVLWAGMAEVTELQVVLLVTTRAELIRRSEYDNGGRRGVWLDNARRDIRRDFAPAFRALVGVARDAGAVVRPVESRNGSFATLELAMLDETLAACMADAASLSAAPTPGH